MGSVALEASQRSSDLRHALRCGLSSEDGGARGEWPHHAREVAETVWERKKEFRRERVMEWNGTGEETRKGREKKKTTKFLLQSFDSTSAESRSTCAREAPTFIV